LLVSAHNVQTEGAAAQLTIINKVMTPFTCYNISQLAVFVKFCKIGIG